MTEQEWLAIGDPLFLLEFFRQTSERKLRLFAVACCRRMDGLLTDERSQRAVTVAEQFAEGLVSEKEFEDARWSAVDAYSAYSDQDDATPESLARVAAADAACSVCRHDFAPAEEEAYGAARATCQGCLRAVGHLTADAAEEKASQVALLRCIFRNPFHPVAFDRAWLTPTVTTLAQAIYQEREFDRMPSLGDALEAAGCANLDILAHCRQPGVHARGCWVVDLLLGKE